MAIVMGTNAGFVTVAPVADPTGAGQQMQGEATVLDDTLPATAGVITEIGYWGWSNGTPDMQVGIYDDNAGVPGALIGAIGTGSVTAAEQWNVISGLSIDVSAHQSTKLFIAIQVDSAGPVANVDKAAEVGVDWSWKAPATELTDPFGALSGTQNDWIVAIYALWTVTPEPPVPELSGAVGGGNLMKHDWKKYPELSNRQMNELEWQSPHRQIKEGFMGVIEKVHDGDTVSIKTNFRDFITKLRIINIDAPELNARGGHEARDYLKGLIEGKEVEIIINPKKRTEKWGRLLGDILQGGILISENMMATEHAVPFDRRRETELPIIKKELNIKKWQM